MPSRERALTLKSHRSSGKISTAAAEYCPELNLDASIGGGPIQSREI